MIVQFRNKLEKVQKEDIETRLIQNGWKPFYIDTEKTILITEHNFPVSQYIDSSLTERVLEMDTPYQLVNRVFRPEGTIVRVGSVEIGASSLVVIAGPCAVESESQLFRVAEIVKRAGGHMLRGGAYKPRTSPYSFQGLGEEGLKLLARAREKFDLPVVTEATSPENADTVAQYADVIQIGARNMQNFELLKKVGRLGKPVLLKRGMSATIEDLLNAAEYILSWGNFDVILCERGIRTIERLTRNTLTLPPYRY